MPGYVMCKVGRGMWNVECGNVEGAGWKEGGGRWEMGAVCLRVGGVADHKAQLAQRTPFNHHRPHPHPPLPFFFTVQCNTARYRDVQDTLAQAEQQSYLAIRRRAAQTLPSSSMDPAQWRASVAAERGRAERPAAASREPSAGATLTTSAGPCQAPSCQDLADSSPAMSPSLQ